MELASTYQVWPWQNTVQGLIAFIVIMAGIVALIWAVNRWM